MTSPKLSPTKAWLVGLALVPLGCAPQAGAPTVSPSAAPSASASAAPSPVASATATPVATALSGVVYDEDANPIAGASIVLQPAAGGDAVAQTTTSGDGTFRLSAPAGGYKAVAAKGGWTTREQAVNLQGATSLNFGGNDANGANPSFLSDTPEVARVKTAEERSGGPLTVTIELSEPLAADAQKEFAGRLELVAKTSVPFVSTGSASIPELRATGAWDSAGKTYTLKYAGPYLPSSSEDVFYSVRLRQQPKGTTDPVTNEPEWEDIGIADAAGHKIGFNRADFAFKKDALFPITFQDLANKTWGYTPALRRWNLTHTAQYTFAAAKDTQGPGFVSVKVVQNQTVLDKTNDVMEIHFTEPMQVAKDQENPTYTRLDADKKMLTVAISESADGSNAKTLIQTASRFRVDAGDPSIVYAYFVAGTFKDKKSVQVIAGDDLRDPAGNRPDPAKSQIVGPIL
jgi:hypothetical protein